MLQIPSNVKVREWPTSVSWFNEQGILYSVSKKAPVQSMEETKRVVEEFKEYTGGKKVCLLIDVTHSAQSSREMRDYAAEEFPKFIKAIAMISDSPLGKMLANLFFTIKSQPYPTKMFNDEKEALEWLQQFL